ncbi:S8 family serine peptidase [Haloglomus litoreum]|uniref:S8 family serine peptidase n=1 Tax=Haloglomus litoreum TaxID=3034026 RepID=UPI0023E8DFC3|nr:S8 family serine peptidase [Haloglomus sp. DT116]
MSGDDSSETNGIELSRRTFTKAAGAAAGAGLLGASAGTAAADDPAMAAKFANPRVQELRKVWKRGYRGNPNRTLGINDSGIDARHPDLGPWNGVRGIVEGDELKLVDQSEREGMTIYDIALSAAVSNPDAFPATAQATPGTFATGQEVTIVEFSTNPGESRFLNAELDWSPSQQNANDLEFRLDKRVGNGEWETVSRTATGSVPERILGAKLAPSTTYRFVAELYVNTISDATVYVDSSNSPNTSESGNPSEDLGFYIPEGPDGELTQAESPFDFGGPADKTVGWIDAGARYGSLAKPRDPNGHGSHVASIAAGTGRASEIAREVESGPDSGTTTVTMGGSELAVVEVEQGEAGVYASAYGDNLEIEIVGVAGVAASSTITSDASTNDNNVASTPAKPGESYIVRVQAASTPSGASAQGESVSLGQGFNTVGRIDSYSIGTFTDPESASNSGDRDIYADTDDDGQVEDDQVALHSGVAPNTSLVGLQGLSGPVPILADHADDVFTSRFNMRAVNMSWGPVGGVPLGVAGGTLDTSGIVSDIGTMAEKGLLTVAAAGNAATPANGNGYPAVADEAVSVVATGPKDGIAAYSSGGIGALDEDENTTYMKPDVTAPGGTLTDLATAAKADTNPENFDTDTEPQGYTGKAGTSMASPFTCGVAGLVADAMEDAGLIEEPAESGINDVFRLKQVLLATASETAFTAAPYHRAKAPTYQFGDRDPFEGYGRVNPDAAVDAATRNWVAEGGGTEPVDAAPGEDVDLGFSAGHAVGLDVPEDARAAAGYVDVTRGEVTFDMTVGSITGTDAGMAAGGHQVDFFVYDLEQPGPHGEPNILAKGQSVSGSQVQLTVYTDGRSLSPQEQPQSSVASIDLGKDQTRRLAVVGKLVNVPGLVNGFDARTDVRFDGSFIAEQLPAFTAEGIRSDSGDRFTPGATNRVNIQLDSMEVEQGEIIEKVPKEWDLLEGFGDYESDAQIVDSTDTHNLVSFGTVQKSELPVTRNYAANAPSSSGSYTFGPARVAIADADVDDDGTDEYRSEETTFGGSDPRNIVVGGAPSSGSGSTSGDDPLSGGDDTLSGDDDPLPDGSDGSSDTTSDDGDSTDDSTDPIGDAVDDTTGTVDDTTGTVDDTTGSL